MLNFRKKIDILIGLGGGLGNRLHTLYCAYDIDLRFKFQFKYFWHEDNGSQISFNDLFDCSKIKILSDESEINNRIKIKNKNINSDQLKEKIYWDCPYSPKIENKQANYYLHKAFKEIKIQKEIKEEIDNFVIPENCLGIHVRGGDIKRKKQLKEDTRVYVPPEKFFSTIDKTDRCIFLSCEDREDEIIFIERYGEKRFIKLINCTHNRNSKKGVKDAFVNLMLLSKCSQIIGITSSFSEVAVKIGRANKINII